MPAPAVTLHVDPSLITVGWFGAFVAHWPKPLGDYASPPWLRAGLRLDAELERPFGPADDGVRKAVRDLLRCGGFKPSGRSKPASEFLLAAAQREELGSINLAVDLCNVVSLHSGIPISVVDLELVTPPLRVAVAAAESSYVFNPSGQTIKLDGLVVLHDQSGPCAGPVKDSQRSKTHAGTRVSLQLLWGPRAVQERCEQALGWYRRLHAEFGVELGEVEIRVRDDRQMPAT